MAIWLVTTFNSRVTAVKMSHTGYPQHEKAISMYKTTSRQSSLLYSFNVSQEH